MVNLNWFHLQRCSSLLPPIIDRHNLRTLRSHDWTDWSDEKVNMFPSRHSPPGNPKRILSYLQDFTVLKDLGKLRPDRSEVIGHDEGRREHWPEGHLCPGLLQRETKVADHQHVRVIPASGTRHLEEPVLVVSIKVNNTWNTVPVILDIIVVPPEVAMFPENFE